MATAPGSSMIAAANSRAVVMSVRTLGPTGSGKLPASTISATRSTLSTTVATSHVTDPPRKKSHAAPAIAVMTMYARNAMGDFALICSLLGLPVVRFVSEGRADFLNVQHGSLSAMQVGRQCSFDVAAVLAAWVSRGHVGPHGDPLADTSIGGPDRLAICGKLDLDPGILVCVLVSG